MPKSPQNYRLSAIRQNPTAANAPQRAGRTTPATDLPATPRKTPTAVSRFMAEAGRKGGLARAKNLTHDQLSAIGRKARAAQLSRQHARVE